MLGSRHWFTIIGLALLVIGVRYRLQGGFLTGHGKTAYEIPLLITAYIIIAIGIILVLMAIISYLVLLLRKLRMAKNELANE